MKINLKRIEKMGDPTRNQKILLDDIFIEKNALSKLPEIMNTYYKDYQSIVMICDENTYNIAGKKVESKLPNINTIVLDPNHLHADEHGVEQADIHLKKIGKIDFLIACGSGTVHDITRYHAYNLGIDFMSIPTAASVDGFVSTMAAMTWKGMKKTFTAVSPRFVLADTEIFSKAPARLTASGVGDLLGKYTALCDWKIAHAVTGEYINWDIVNWEYDILEELVQTLDGLSKNDEKAYENLMYGLLMSGLAMQLMGYSRPASCCEHHCSHLWEEAAINEPIDFYHGEKVGVGMIICTQVYKKALSYLKRGDYTLHASVDVEFDLIKDNFKNEILQEEILKENEPNIMENITGKMLKDRESDIISILETLPNVTTMMEWINKVNGCTSMNDIGLSEDLRPLTLKLSPYVRKRLSFMRLLKFYDFYNAVIE